MSYISACATNLKTFVYILVQ